MAASPPSPRAQTVWSDLLFSPQPAWLWDADREAFVWANPSARERFGPDLAFLGQKLPRRTLRRLSAVARYKRRPALSRESLPLEAGSTDELLLDLEGFRLADGHAGLIVKAAPGDDKAGPANAKPSARAKTTAALRQKMAPRPAAKAAAAKAGPSALTPEELAAFRAIGRKVRRLCREKRQAASASIFSAKPGQPAPRPSTVTPAREDAASRLVEAFDALIRIDHDGRILSLGGRLCRHAGWTLRDYRGHDLTRLAHDGEHAALRSIFARLAANPLRVASDDVLLQGRDGSVHPCRVVMTLEGAHDPDSGRQPAVLIAITSLKVKPRLVRKLHGEGDSVAQLRIAA